MIKLLNAHFARLCKNKLFWILVLFSIGLAMLMIYTQYSNMKKYNDVIKVEQMMLNYSTIVGIVIAIFSSLFLGTEYSDGAIRNKISIGHKRANIYLSNLIVVTITSLFSYILFLVIIVSVGIPLFGSITMSISKLIISLGSIFVTIIAYSSIFTFVAMIISNKTITSIVSIMLAFGLTIFALVCLDILQTPKFNEYASITDSESGGVKMLREPNPKYPSEEQKKVCQTLLNINPAGQMFQLVGRNSVNLKILPIYSLGIVVVFTGTGLVLFRKKELK